MTAADGGWTKGPDVFGLKTFIAPASIKLLDMVILTNGDETYGWRPGLPQFVKLPSPPSRAGGA